MYTVIGALLFAVAVTLFTWSAVQFRQPVPANWTRSPYAAMALALTSVASLLLSAAFVSQAYLTAAPGEYVSVLVLAVAAAVICAGAFATRQMVLQWQNLNQNQGVYAADFSGAMEGAALTAANDDSTAGGRNPVPGAPKGSKPRRRKAA